MLPAEREIKRKYEIEHIMSQIYLKLRTLHQYYSGRTHFMPFTPKSFKDRVNKTLGMGWKTSCCKENEK
jgi:hypothetical protein